eukprot:979528_1
MEEAHNWLQVGNFDWQTDVDTFKWVIIAVLPCVVASVWFVFAAWKFENPKVPQALFHVRVLNLIGIVVYELVLVCQIFKFVVPHIILNTFYEIVAEVALVMFMINILRSSAAVAMQQGSDKWLHPLKAGILGVVVVVPLLFMAAIFLYYCKFVAAFRRGYILCFWSTMVGITGASTYKIITMLRAHMKTMKRDFKQSTGIYRNTLIKLGVLIGLMVFSLAEYLCYLAIRAGNSEVHGLFDRRSLSHESWRSRYFAHLIIQPILRWFVLTVHAHVPSRKKSPVESTQDAVHITESKPGPQCAQFFLRAIEKSGEHQTTLARLGMKSGSMFLGIIKNDHCTEKKKK